MREIVVGLEERQYPIRIGSDCVAELGPQARAALPRCDRLLVVSNPEIARLHAAPVLESLRGAGLETELFEIPEGETHKNVDTVGAIWDHLIMGSYTRQSAIAALGGGVVGDVAGFAAASYMRGIGYIQLPTTLLAMVDSSVGGKTGINHPHAKNIIGAFWQPKLVFMDMALLGTLFEEEFRSGFAEVIKHGVIRDAGYFAYLEDNLDAIFALDGTALAHVVAGSCEIKADVVAQDEREGGLRAILNCGHTLGHAIEALTGYGGARHGEAVAVGMIAAARIAAKMDLTSEETETRLRALIERASLPTRFPELDVAVLIARLRTDKKVRDGRVRFVLPTRIGDVTIRDDVPSKVIEETVRGMM